MKTKKLTFISLSLLSLTSVLAVFTFLSVLSFGQVSITSFNSSYDLQTKMVKIKGIMDSSKATNVTIKVTTPSGTISNVTQIKSDNGIFTYEYILNNPENGIYTVLASSSGLTSPSQTSFSTSTGKTGDLNDDTYVDSTDYAILKRFLLGIIKELPTSNPTYSGDLNGDSLIDSTDFALLKRYLLGIISEFPK